MDYKQLILVFIFGAVCVRSANVSPKIAGGEEVTNENRKNHNYIVTVAQATDMTNAKICTGVLLHEEYVMVTAHCVKGASDIYVIPRGIEDAANLVRASVLEIHGDYNPDTLGKDIAIVKLHNSFTLSDNLNTIEVGSETPADNTKCTVSGYGRNPEKLGISLLPGKAFFYEVVIKNKDTCSASGGQICAGVAADANTKSLCQGDDGAPLVCDGKVVAIAVKPDKCGKTNSDVFMELKDLRSWIYDRVPSSAVSVVLSPLALMLTFIISFKMRS